MRVLTDADARLPSTTDALWACESEDEETKGDDASAWTRERLARALKAPRTQCVIVCAYAGGGAGAAELGELIGYALSASDDAMVATIERVCVKKSRRRRGVGGRLVREMGRALYARRIYDVGCKVPDELEGFFIAQNYDEDEDGCVHMRFEGKLEDVQNV